MLLFKCTCRLLHNRSCHTILLAFDYSLGGSKTLIGTFLRNDQQTAELRYSSCKRKRENTNRGEHEGDSLFVVHWTGALFISRSSLIPILFIHLRQRGRNEENKFCFDFNLKKPNATKLHTMLLGHVLSPNLVKSKRKVLQTPLG